MVNTILVGTHHKTGTKWMENWLSRFASLTGITFYQIGPELDFRTYPVDVGRAILFQDHSYFSNYSSPNARGIHIIRDPRDVIISGASYHSKSDEAWLLKRQRRFLGRNYQEMINSYKTLEDRLCFEMRNLATATIRDMIEFQDDRFLTVKYEDLFMDLQDLKIVEKIADHLEIFNDDRVALYHSYQLSHLKSVTEPNLHVSSGVVEQWRTVFTDRISQEFISNFPGVLEKLGYSS